MRGQMSVPGKMMIFLASAAILLGLAASMMPEIIGNSKDAVCYLSATVNFRHSVGGKKITSLKCERHDLFFENKDVLSGKALKKIEQRIQACWGTMLKGESEQFNKNLFVGGSNPCLVCATVNFDENIDVKSLSGLSSYLKQSKDGQPSTWDLVYGPLFKVDSPVIVFSEGKWQEGEMLTDEEYYMIYKVYNDAWRSIDIFEKEEKATIPIVRGKDLGLIGCDYFYN